jgi:1,2-diacylglycerol 3-alpha-glucosyltransferase
MIFVGRMGKEKSIDVFIEALPVLTKKYPKLRLMLVGGGPEKQDLEKRSEALGVRKAVVFTGYLPQATLPLAYKASDFYVIASKTESQGLVTVEAMTSGLPVIACEDLAHLDILGDRENAIIFKTDADFAPAVTQLLENHGLMQALRAKSLARSGNFTLKEFGARVEEYYQWVIEDFKQKEAKHV